MALIGRIFIDIFAFFLASIVAAAMIWYGIVGPELNGAGITGEKGILGLLVGAGSLVLAGAAFGPALVLIVIAEGFGIRSIFFYAIAGAAIALFLYYGIGFETNIDERWQSSEGFFARAPEIMAAAGIAAGLVYWLVAGRRAGAWRSSEL